MGALVSVNMGNRSTTAKTVVARVSAYTTSVRTSVNIAVALHSVNMGSRSTTVKTAAGRGCASTEGTSEAAKNVMESPQTSACMEDKRADAKNAEALASANTTKSSCTASSVRGVRYVNINDKELAVKTVVARAYAATDDRERTVKNVVALVFANTEEEESDVRTVSD